MPRRYNAGYRRVYKKKTASNSMYRKKWMPFKRTYRKKFGSTATSVAIYKPMQQVFPDVLRTTLRNNCGVNWTGTAGAVNAYVIIGNSFHNPLSSGPLSGAVALSVGSATNIYGLSNLLSADATFGAGAPYNQYRILGASLKASTQTNNHTTINVGGTLCIQCVDGNTIVNMGNVNALTLSETTEAPYSKKFTVTGNTTNQGVTSYHKMTTCKMAGLRNESSCEQSEYAGTYGSSPANLWFWVLTWFPDSSSDTPATSTITLDYEVEFFNRNALASTNG